MTKPSPKNSPDESLTGAVEKPAALSFLVDEAPDVGSAYEIAKGVYWVRMGLPMTGLDHINLWVLKDKDSWMVVDTGLATRDSKAIWKKHFGGFMKGRPVSRVLCTHLHPDHTGLAGWMCEEFGAPLLMTRGEYFLCRLMVADTGQPAPKAGIVFYQKAGLTPEQIELYKMRFGGFGKAVSPLPHNYDRLVDGELGMINGKEWRIVTGAGHSPEHACLWSPELKICMTGDQLLPNISSNVSVWPTEPEANPLEDWISSCHKLKRILPDDTLILPAHGLPFRGAHRRLDKLILHHEKALDRLHAFCETPRLATEVYSVLFRRKINDSNRLLAVGESIAHLNCLKKRGRVKRRLNDAGQFVYRSV